MAQFREEYHEKFEPKTYLNKFYSDSACVGEDNSAKRTIEKLYKQFSKEEHKKGGRLLDIGSGPTLHLAFCASRVYNEITLSEYADCNREELMKWVNKEQDAFDWSEILSYVGEIEQCDPKLIDERTRKALKEVIPVDMLSSNIFQPNTREKFDCITSTLCLECCFKDVASFANGVKKIASHVTDHGTLYLSGVFGETYYKFGTKPFHYLKVNRQEVEQSVKDAGFDIKQMDVFDVDLENWNEIPDVSCNGYAVYDLTAMKTA